MDILQALQQRRSVRAFAADRGRRDGQELLEKASQAASGGNMQPWRVTAVGGQALKELSAKAKATEAVQRPGLSYPPGLWEPYRSRRFENGEDLYRAIGIGREDKTARLAQLAKNSQMFGAPVGILWWKSAWVMRNGWIWASICNPSCCWPWKKAWLPAPRVLAHV